MANDERPVKAEELSAKHLKRLVKVSPGLHDEPSVSGRLVEVHHTVGNLVRIVIRLDEANELAVFLRPGVPIAFWEEPTR